MAKRRDDSKARQDEIQRSTEEMRENFDRARKERNDDWEKCEKEYMQERDKVPQNGRTVYGLQIKLNQE